MNGHFSPEQISRWMIGEQTAQGQEHARQCADCAAKIAGLESAIALFRESVRDSGDRYGGAGLRMPVRSRRVWSLRWAPAAVVLSLLVTFPIYTGLRERRRQAEMDRADAVLMEQVDAGISRAVPAPMEPLVRMVAWNTKDQATTGETR